jgi:DNA-binding PucR family transcriptional regulator
MTSRAAGVIFLVPDGVDVSGFGRALSDLDGPIRVGVSGRHDVTTLRQSIREAESALRMSSAAVVTFDDLGVWRLLAQADPERIASYIDEWIGPLVEYDADHRAHLVDTLAAFLAGQGAQASIAIKLHIHRSTLKYRLGRVRELTGRDLSDSEVRFNLELACRAHRTRSTMDEGVSEPRPW